MFPPLDGRAWTGSAGAFVIELFESWQRPGYYYFAIACMKDGSCQQMQRPAKTATAEEDLGSILQEDYGVLLDDFAWEKTQPSELLLLMDQVASGN
jgi:hypothetical protein